MTFGNPVGVTGSTSPAARSRRAECAVPRVRHRYIQRRHTRRTRLCRIGNPESVQPDRRQRHDFPCRDRDLRVASGAGMPRPLPARSVSSTARPRQLRRGQQWRVHLGGVTVRTGVAGGNVGTGSDTLINQGLISAQTPGTTITLFNLLSATNTGTIQAIEWRQHAASPTLLGR